MVFMAHTPGQIQSITTDQPVNGRYAIATRWLLIVRQFLVRKHERGLLFRKGNFIAFLEPGEYRYFDPLGHIQIELYDLSNPVFIHRLTDFFIKEYAEKVSHYFKIIELTDQQVGLLYRNKQLVQILAPATRTLFWQGMVDVDVKIIDISSDYTVTAELAAILVYTKDEKLKTSVRIAVQSSEIPEYHVGLLKVDGQYVKTLTPGLQAFWQFNRNIVIDIVDMRLQLIEISGQEILTKDKVSLRINLSADYVIRDPLKALSQLSAPKDFIYRELQFGLRAAVGTRTLDELLENKTLIDESVFHHIAAKTADLGLEIRSVGVKDIILPGEMKVLLSKVVEAEKVAQANIIRRREETAATRSLLNTAKVMEENPTALRLKELETLERVVEKVDSISVYGGLEGLLKELIRLRSSS